MDAINTREAFAEAVRKVAAGLKVQLADEGEPEATDATLHELFEQGKELGLTEKEVIQQLIGPVSEILRPGLNR